MNYKLKFERKSNFLRIFAIYSAIITLTAQVGIIHAQGTGGAYFTKIIVNNGLDFIDLVNGGQAKVMLGQSVWCNLTFYNDKVGVLGAKLFTKLYVDGSLIGISSSQYIFRYLTGSQFWRLPELEAGFHNVRVELWWDDSGTYYLEDARTFQVYVVQLVPSLSAPQVDVPKGSAKGSGWVVSVTNDGNDIMCRTTISVVDSAGLQIYPQTASLEDLLAGAVKSTLFTVVAPGSLAIGQYTVKFSVGYSDFVGNYHREYFQGTVTVTKSIATVSITLDKISAVVGETVTIQATLTSNGLGLSGQKIEFYADDRFIDYGTTDSSGRAIMTYALNLTPGTHTIRAHFAETVDFLESSGTTNIVILAIPTSIILTAPTSLTEGVGATITAVLMDSKGTPLQGQSVKFLANGTVIGSATTDSSGKASFEFMPKAPGSIQIQAKYEGAGNYAASSSQISTVQVASNTFSSSYSIIIGLIVALVVLATAYLALQQARKRQRSS